MPSRRYYMLIASLPNMPPTLTSSGRRSHAQRLNERLRMLHEEDAAVIDQVADFLAWDRQPLDRNDAEVCAHYDQLIRTIGNPLVRQLVDTRMNVRTIVGAVRRRRAGQGPPSGVGAVGRSHPPQLDADLTSTCRAAFPGSPNSSGCWIGTIRWKLRSCCSR